MRKRPIGFLEEVKTIITLGNERICKALDQAMAAARAGDPETESAFLLLAHHKIKAIEELMADVVK